MESVENPDQTLADMPIGAVSQIQKLSGDMELNRSLREIGFYEGAIIKVQGRMPFHGPMVIELDSCSLALRLGEAQQLIVRRCP